MFFSKRRKILKNDYFRKGRKKLSCTINLISQTIIRGEGKKGEIQLNLINRKKMSNVQIIFVRKTNKNRVKVKKRKKKKGNVIEGVNENDI